MNGRCPNKLDFGCFEWVLFIKSKLKCESFSCIERVFSTVKADMPDFVRFVNNYEFKCICKVLVDVLHLLLQTGSLIHILSNKLILV